MAKGAMEITRINVNLYKVYISNSNVYVFYLQNLLKQLFP